MDWQVDRPREREQTNQMPYNVRLKSSLARKKSRVTELLEPTRPRVVIPNGPNAARLHVIGFNSRELFFARSLRAKHPFSLCLSARRNP
jgi:hypothetical protein